LISVSAFQSNTLSAHQGAGQGDTLFSYLAKSINQLHNVNHRGSRNVIKCREGTHQMLYCDYGES